MKKIRIKKQCPSSVLVKFCPSLLLNLFPGTWLGYLWSRGYTSHLIPFTMINGHFYRCPKVESRTFEPNPNRILDFESNIRKIWFRTDASDLRFEEIRRFDSTNGHLCWGAQKLIHFSSNHNLEFFLEFRGHL